MNEQLNILNKKIRLLNEVMKLDALFNGETNFATKHYATKALHELLSKQCKMMLPFAEREVMKVAKLYRDTFFNKEVELKRKVHNDRLINVYIQEPLTGHICPLNTQAFIKMMEKIKV